MDINDTVHDDQEREDTEVEGSNSDKRTRDSDPSIHLLNIFDEETWDELGKKMEDLTELDLQRVYFRSKEACEAFYYTYAKVKGFKVRKHGLHTSKTDDVVISRTLVCNKEGARHKPIDDQPYDPDDIPTIIKRNKSALQKKLREDKDMKNRRAPRAITRQGCQAHIKFSYNRELELWCCVSFETKHNHEMVSPIHLPYLSKSRNTPAAYRKKILEMRESGIALSGIYRNLVISMGDQETLGFVPKELYNYCDMIKKEEVKDGDAETVLAYLTGKKAGDPKFFLSYTRDEDNRLDKLFWCDGQSISDYKNFGHALAFDTTYKCNAYSKPFVVLVGVNHNKKTVPFACALVVNEKEDSFKWVLQQLIKAGDGMKPLTVITDGDFAMANAIKEVLPKARHRLCLWHIMKNFISHAPKGFTAGFMYCVDKCNTINDFEKAWAELIKFYKLESKDWVKNLYKNKEKWAEVYLRGYFFAGMRSTQRCESMHRTLKTLLHQKLMLYRFVLHYDQAVRAIRFEDGYEDYRTIHERPCITGKILEGVKHDAAKHYTRCAYQFVEREMKFERFYVVKKEEADEDDQKSLFLNHINNPKLKYNVIYNQSESTMLCSCTKLESVGFPCRHMFAVMKHQHMDKIPHGCILHRWTLQSKVNPIERSTSLEDQDDPLNVLKAREANLYALLKPLVDQAIHTEEDYEAAKNKFAKFALIFGDQKSGKNSCSDIHKEEQNTHQHQFQKKKLFGIGNPMTIEKLKGRIPNRKKKKGVSKMTANLTNNVEKPQVKVSGPKLVGASTKGKSNATPSVFAPKSREDGLQRAQQHLEDMYIGGNVIQDNDDRPWRHMRRSIRLDWNPGDNF